MSEGPPAGYVLCELGRARLLVAEPLSDWVRQIVEQHGSLYRYARDASCGDVAGRGPAFIVPLPAELGLGFVRWLRHGGLLARFTGDRFLRRGTPRPENELLMARRLAACGLATPRVWAACVYPGALWYRGEVLRAWRSDCTDLAAFLGSPSTSAEAARNTLARAREFASELAACGVCHVDFNARNVLVPADGSPLAVIDLEKAVACRPNSRRAAIRMEKRLLHSLSGRARSHSGTRESSARADQGGPRDGRR